MSPTSCRCSTPPADDSRSGRSRPIGPQVERGTMSIRPPLKVRRMTTDDLLAAARAARENAHAPYSGYRVGAALRDELGRVHAGANVENAAYPASAIGVLVAAGGRRIVEALVVADGPEPATPCGGCRQRLRELGSPEMPVHLALPEAIVRSVTLGELLPHSFGPAHLAPEHVGPGHLGPEHVERPR